MQLASIKRLLSCGILNLLLSAKTKRKSNLLAHGSVPDIQLTQAYFYKPDLRAGVTFTSVKVYVKNGYAIRLRKS